MINEPSVCLGALWIPYRRDPAVMKAVLGQCASAPEISMVFCHADVRGAYMNDNMRSKEGLDVTCFPKDLPIYSGHFHKPHTVRISAAAVVLRLLYSCLPPPPPPYRSKKAGPRSGITFLDSFFECFYCLTACFVPLSA
jgi:hypothetical protein